MVMQKTPSPDGNINGIVNEMMGNLGKNILNERYKHGMTMTDIYHETGICPATIRRAEDGKASIWTALTLCVYLGIDIGEAVRTPREVRRISKTR